MTTHDTHTQMQLDTDASLQNAVRSLQQLATVACSFGTGATGTTVATGAKVNFDDLKNF